MYLLRLLIFPHEANPRTLKDLKFFFKFENPFLNKIENLLNNAFRFEKIDFKKEIFLCSAFNIGNQANSLLTGILKSILTAI